MCASCPKTHLTLEDKHLILYIWHKGWEQYSGDVASTEWYIVDNQVDVQLFWLIDAAQLLQRRKSLVSAHYMWMLSSFISLYNEQIIFATIGYR